jgi:hypothetical protein
MAVKSTWRGHPMEWIGEYGEEGTWVYSDTKTPVSQNPNRDCASCGLPSTKEGHDACLGTLPGAMNACCGHGDVSYAYIQYNDGHTVRDKKAAKEIRRCLAKKNQMKTTMLS